jgi:hypothetical protein
MLLLFFTLVTSGRIFVPNDVGNKFRDVESRNGIPDWSDVWCCYHAIHTHDCYEAIKGGGCVVGPALFFKEPFQDQKPKVVNVPGTEHNLNDPPSYSAKNFQNHQPYFILCSATPECEPTEMGGVFLRGVRKNCQECVKPLVDYSCSKIKK